MTTNKKYAEQKSKFSIKRLWKESSYIFIFLIIFVAYLIVNGKATNWMALTNILRHSSVIGVVALAMGLIVLLGDIDLSVGSTIALVGGISVLVFNATNSLILTLLFGIVMGMATGFVNGVFVGVVGMPAFIATLSTMLMYRSISQSYLHTTGVAMYKLDAGLSSYDAIFYLGNGNVFSIPLLAIIFFVVAGLLTFMTSSTKFGKTIYAVGSNEKAAKLSGINTKLVRVVVYTISGALIGLAAVMFAGQNGTVTPSSAGKNYELYAIAAVVIGGISMTGGKGKISGIIFGMLSFTLIDKIILSLGLNPLINDTIKGAILIVAIIFQMTQNRKEVK